MQYRFMEPRRTALSMHGAVYRTARWKVLFFMLLLVVLMLTSVPLVTMVQSARAESTIKTIMKDPKTNPGAALGTMLHWLINECGNPAWWEHALDYIVQKKKAEFPNWSVAAVRNGERLSGEGTCSMETETVAVCGIHEVLILWGKHDRKCWFRNNGDGGYNNWVALGGWTKKGNEMWIGY